MSIVKVEPNKLQNDYDGFELYYDKQERCVFSSPKGLARWVDCDPKTIKRLGSSLNLGKTAETLTGQGLRMGTLYTSAEVITILSALIDGKRTKQQTRDNARNRLTLLATIGNELGAMLAVAPEELANRAINNITTIEQLDDVQEHVSSHRMYLDEYHGLHEELRSRNAQAMHHATINKHNNKLVGVEDGGRPHMDENQKDALTFFQLAEKMKLRNTKTYTAWHAVNVAKNAGDYAKLSLAGLLE